MAVAVKPPAYTPALQDAERITPTGLTLADLRPLTRAEKELLQSWMLTKAGNDDGRPWWPLAIRSMPVDIRLKLAADPELDAAWCERERRKVAKSHIYFTVMYGSVQPEEGPPAPFLLWPAQAQVLADFRAHLRNILLKARQLGLTWLALHDAVHVLAFDPATPNARVLALSKHGGDATKLLERARKIIALLPEFLRPTEDAVTRQSKTELKLVGRGKMVSLAGSPEAARMETATLVILDEFAHIKNGNAAKTWTAVLPTMGRRGRAIVIFTGNGPAEAPGDGQAAARLWQMANSGDAGDAEVGEDGERVDLGGVALHPVFLPSSTDPLRTDAWRAAKRREFLDDFAFLAEFPETEEEALAGDPGGKVYSPQGINAAESLGRELDALMAVGNMEEPADGFLHIGADFGEHTHFLLKWQLEGAGTYITGEIETESAEVGETILRVFDELVVPLQRKHPDTGEWFPKVKTIRYDAAGVQSIRTVLRTIEQRPDLLARCETVMRYRPELKRKVRSVSVVRVAFNLFKDDTKDWIRHLFTRTQADQPTRVVAISPSAPVLLRQLRGLKKKDDGTGRIEKGDDHGPDAMIAVEAPEAARHHDRGAQLQEDAA